MKRILSLFLVVVICLSLCACELPEGIVITPNPNPSASQSTTPETEPTPTETESTPTETQPPKPTKEEVQACVQYYYIYQFLHGKYTSWAESLERVGGNMSSTGNPSVFEQLTVKDVVNGQVYTGMEALAFCRETLPKLEEAVNKWSSEQINFVSDREAFRNYWSVQYWDCERLRAGISATRDVLLFQYESSQEQKFWNRWVYDAEGRIAWTNANWRSENIYSSADYPLISLGITRLNGTYLYDEEGKLKTVQTANQECGHRRTMSFDYNADTGVLNIEEVYHALSHRVDTLGQHDTWTKTYSVQFIHDEEGRLVQIPWGAGSIRYYYDDAGRLIKQAYCDYDGDFDPEQGGNDLYDYTYAKVEYTYDDNGYLSSAVASTKLWRLADVFDKNGNYIGMRSYIYREQTNQIQYVCDEQGRVVEKTVHYGDDTIYWNGGKRPEVIQEARTTVHHYIYGDYYIYTPVE